MTAEEYQKYEAFRIALTAQQSAMLEEKTDPLERITAHEQIARETARTTMDQVHPESFEECMRFPHINPLGKANAKQLEFVDRFQKISVMSALNKSETPAQMQVDAMISQINGRKGSMADYRRDMEQACAASALDTRAAKLCHDKFAADRLENSAKERMSSKAIQDYDHILTSMEYMVGLRTEPLSRETLDVCADMGVSNLVIETAQPRDKLEPKLSVNFSNFDNLVQVAAATSPQNWNRKFSEMPKEFKEGPAGQQVLDAYTAATANSTLTTLFTGLETPGKMTFPNRSNMITVDGKSIRQMMIESYNGSSADFDAYYKENCMAQTNQMVAAGLMAGKRVEVFVPDAAGKLPAEPMQLGRTGYEPTPLTPVTLGKWDRFIHKFGFAKEKFAQAEEYQRISAGRDMIRADYASNPFGTNSSQDLLSKRTADALYSGAYAEMGTNHNAWKLEGHFRPGRMGTMSACTAVLLDEGHSFEDILDPTKLKAEKASAVQEYVRRGKAGDNEWLLETYNKGLAHMSALGVEYVKNGVLTTMEGMANDSRMLNLYSFIAKDMYQERNNIVPLGGMEYEPTAKERESTSPSVQGRVENYDKGWAYASTYQNPLAGTDSPYANLSGSDFLRQTTNATQLLTASLLGLRKGLSANQELMEGQPMGLGGALQKSHEAMSAHQIMGQLKERADDLSFLHDAKQAESFLADCTTIGACATTMGRNTCMNRCRDEAVREQAVENIRRTCTIDQLEKNKVTYKTVDQFTKYPVGKDGKSLIEQASPGIFKNETARFQAKEKQELAKQAQGKQAAPPRPSKR